jgi:hypothetical protein
LQKGKKMALTAKERLEMAKKGIQASTKRAEEKDNQPANEQIDWSEKNKKYLSFKTGEKIPFRVLMACAPDLADRNEFDPKLVQHSYIVDDKGDTKKVFWSNENGWFLRRVYNKIMSYDYDPDGVRPDGKKGVRIYKNEHKYPELFNRVSKNNKKNPSAFEKGWMPRKSYVIQGVGRDAVTMDFHKKMNKTVMLTKEIKNGFPFPGINYSTWTEQFITLIANHGPIEAFDIILNKEIRGDDVYYHVERSNAYTVSNEALKELPTDDFRRVMDTNPLQADENDVCWELELEKINLDEEFKHASYLSIASMLGKFIQKVDEQMNTDFTSELIELMNNEKIEWDSRSADDYPYDNNTTYSRANVLDADGKVFTTEVDFSKES